MMFGLSGRRALVTGALGASTHTVALALGVEPDAINDKLPAVSWVIPTSYQSEHPDYTPADGAAFVASKIDAIAAKAPILPDIRMLRLPAPMRLEE